MIVKNGAMRQRNDVSSETIDVPHLIVVDDEENFAEYICEVATSLGFKTTSFATPADFLAAQLSGNEIIFLDLYMPNINGIELIRHLAGLQCSPASVVLMSGADASILKSAHELAAELGLNIAGSIRKPVPLDDLVSLIKLSSQKSIYTNNNHEHLPSLIDLELSLKNKTIEAYFQPQYNCFDNTLVGFESLARWNHEKFGYITPQIFVSMAEYNNMIYELDCYILEYAVDTLYSKMKHCLRPPTLSVNMSANSLNDLTLPERIKSILDKYYINPNQLTIEITESSIFSNFGLALDTLTRLRMDGIKLSIDDFGTGYSSMSKLMRIPFTELKIDRSFVTNANADKECLAIVRASISLARELGITTVAEGVEDQATLDMLRQLGCNHAQGYYLDRPLPATALSKFS